MDVSRRVIFAHMKLLEYQGKRLFKKYGIAVPKGTLLSHRSSNVNRQTFPVVLKAQIPIGERKKAGGVIVAKNTQEAQIAYKKIIGAPIAGYIVKKILAEELVQFEHEYYLSFSYSGDSRTPVLAISKEGGKPVWSAHQVPIDPVWGIRDFLLRDKINAIGIPYTNGLKKVITSLWKLLNGEHALVAEINPLFSCADDRWIAGDAKVILDDNVVDPSYRPLLDLGGDIGILASGGGASLTNLDALMRHGGRPANYVEYSGNPKADVVEALTKKVLGRKGLKGAWVIGGTANFTDIHETLTGFVNGLRKIKPRPTYPIVIRRDGPRRKEAFEMLKDVGEKEGYDFHLYGSEISMSDSGKIMTQLAYQKSKSHSVTKSLSKPAIPND